MAGKGKAGAASGVVVAGCILLGAVLLAIAGMIVISLISLYPPNRSSRPSGSLYRVNGAMLKTLYSDTGVSLVNSSVVDNTALGTACSFAARAAGGTSNFAGCVVRNLRAYGGNNSNTTRRRRAPEFGAYAIGSADLYFSTTCEKSTDTGKYAGATDLSSCANNRLSVCNGVSGTSNTFNQWTRLENGASITFLDTSITYVTRALVRVFGIPYALARTIAASLSATYGNVGDVGTGCTFVRTVSQDEIAAALLAASTATTTLPTSTNANSG